MINVRDNGDVADVLHIVNFRSAHVAQYTRRDKGHEWESGGFAGLRIMEICRQRSSHACENIAWFPGARGAASGGDRVEVTAAKGETSPAQGICHSLQSPQLVLLCLPRDAPKNLVRSLLLTAGLFVLPKLFELNRDGIQRHEFAAAHIAFGRQSG
jgi:hypothetical protein